MSLRKITRGQKRAVSLKFLKEQGGICPLCGKVIDPKIAGNKGDGMVLDHDHITGRCRGVLHRSCNAAEGKAFNAMGRWCVGKMDYELVVPALERLVEYLKREPSELIYDNHKSEEDKRAVRATRERKRRAEIKARREAARIIHE